VKVPTAHRPPTPALEAWRRRLASGQRGEDLRRSFTWRLDALWRAACAEASALEAWADGMSPEVVAADLDRAERHLTQEAA
jgi:hypothetical protein